MFDICSEKNALHVKAVYQDCFQQRLSCVSSQGHAVITWVLLYKFITTCIQRRW